jgi:integrase
MMSSILTDSKIKAIQTPKSGQIEISDTAVPGLRIRIGKSGKKTFILRKRVDGRPRNLTIGTYGPRLGLAEARKKVRLLINDIESGKAITIKSAGVETIGSLWPSFRQAKSQLRSIKEIERIFERYILPELGDRIADAVTRHEITQFIDSIEAPVMARSVHAQLSSFYGWAMPRLDKLEYNPCLQAGRPNKPAPKDRVLTDEELGALYIIGNDHGLPWGVVVQLLILTGQRRSEVLNADRSEFDLGKSLWTIPAARSKNGVTNLVPLSSQAKEIISNIPIIDGSAKLFPARGNAEQCASGVSKAVNRFRGNLCEALEKEVDHWSLHDIRRTVATGLQKLGVRFEVTEAVLNHKSGSKSGVAGVYQKHDWFEEKTTAMQDWAGEVDRIVGSATKALKKKQLPPRR